MSSTLKDIIKNRLDAADIPQSLPPAEQFSERDRAEVRAAFPPMDPQIVSALEAAARALHESHAGQELARRALDMTPREVLALAGDVARIPEIRHVAELAKRPGVFAASRVEGGGKIKDLVSNYAPQSLIVNFCFMGDAFVGVTGFVGFAYDLDDFNRYSLFIGGSIGIGVDAVVAAGQGVGLSANAYSDMTGACVGADIGGAAGAGLLLDGSIGYSPVARTYHPDQWTGIVYFLEGAGAGVEFYFGYTLLLVNQSLPDIFQPRGASRTTISRIACERAEDAIGKDELYFEVTTDVSPGRTYRYPLWDYFSIEEGKSWDVGFTINFNAQFEVTLYNAETNGANKITSFTVTSQDIPGQGSSKRLEYDNGSGMFHNHVHYLVDLYTPKYG
ncbi:hypothetical protein [Sphingobium sp. CFD-2]|uniref:hypothetical protein n=1 Tax=Sphingobium sp. CFD-2 TaxID=2878542 RepID=UPI00214D111A|nr:hypothetical protein [Sphingobium sp. CFD-2]